MNTKINTTVLSSVATVLIFKTGLCNNTVKHIVFTKLHWSTQFNFFLSHEEKYLILIELLTLNSNM
jgi:hypothetical protein